jgi:hypothetical protein
LIIVIPFSLKGQDTVFISKHNFNSPVRNVFIAKDEVYVKTGTELYKMSGEKWESIANAFKKSYMFYDKDFFETDFPPTQYLFDVSSMAHLIPQTSLSNPCKVTKHDRLYISVGGSLYEYQINPYYNHQFKGYSVRNHFKEKGLSILSTYSGIFINDSIRATGPGYSNGVLSKIKGQYFLCADFLYRFIKPAQFEIVDSTDISNTGYYRKLIFWKGHVYAQNTKTINIYDSLQGLTTIHQGYEYSDLEPIKDSLYFCTTTGEVFRYANGKSEQLINLNTRIRGIYHQRNKTFFSSDQGVYTIENGDSLTLKKWADLPNALNVRVDVHNNAWIATENGLYLIPSESNIPIPFISNVEFNRGALNYSNDLIYAGSVDGLYIVDIFSVMKSFLPQYFNKKRLEDSSSQKKYIVYLILTLLALTGLSYYIYKVRKITIQQPDKTIVTLDAIRDSIYIHNIMTVDGLAEYYKTNTVQLNRLFKKYDTTPGKFLKSVKMKLAMELTKKGEPMETIVAKTGYTAHYIKKNLSL